MTASEGLAITAVDFSCYRWERDPPISNGQYTYTHSTLCVVEVKTNAGISGLGLAADPGMLAGERVLSGTIDMLRPALLGKNPLATDDLWNQMWAPKLVGRRGLTTRAISGIDIALWDIRGKVADQDLTTLLGGSRKQLPYYVAGGYYEPGKTTADLVDEVVENVSTGATAVKLKVGRLPIAEDVSRIAAVRDTLGDKIEILIDANGAYRVHDAVRLARALEPLNIFWLEEPVAADDYEGYRRVRDRTSIPIAGGENEYTLYGFRELIEGNCVDIINADAQILGGITEFRKVTALAEAHGISLAPHGNQDLHAHLMSATRSALVLEYYPPAIETLWHKFHKSELDPVGGLVSAGSRPGVGIDLDWEALQEFRVTVSP